LAAFTKKNKNQLYFNIKYFSVLLNKTASNRSQDFVKMGQIVTEISHLMVFWKMTVDYLKFELFNDCYGPVHNLNVC